uniref:Putative secreted protein n=1 Tax=Anopheles marajoara TaxID=58244 RepID=A0A2M4CEQ9_9DIPT
MWTLSFRSHNCAMTASAPVAATAAASVASPSWSSDGWLKCQTEREATVMAHFVRVSLLSFCVDPSDLW